MRVVLRIVNSIAMLLGEQLWSGFSAGLPRQSLSQRLHIKSGDLSEWCNPDLIQSPPVSAVTPNLVPFLRGYWSKSNSEILVVLDGNSIIAGMPQPKVDEAI